MSKIKTQTLIEITICAALALLIDLLIPSPSWSFKVSVKMIPIIILALRRGTLAGCLGGFLWGLLQYITGNAYVLTLVQFVIEYFVAFSVIGFAGFFAPYMQKILQEDPTNRMKQWVTASMATIVGSLARYIVHFIAGVWFWGSYAPEGQSPFVYSFLVNGGAFLSETLCCIIVLIFLTRSFQPLLRVKTSGY